MSEGKPKKKVNPEYAEIRDVARAFVRSMDRATAHSEEHDRIDEAKDKDAGEKALELITVVLSHAVTRHPTAIEHAYLMVQNTKGRR